MKKSMKTRSVNKFVILAGKSENKTPVPKLNSITSFETFTLSLFNSGVCLTFNNGNAPNLKKHQSQTAKNSKVSVNKIYNFSWKKKRKEHKNLRKSEGSRN